MTKFARKCNVTNQGMNKGWVINDGIDYVSKEEDAIAICSDAGYSSMEEAFEDEFIYYTEWTDKEDYQYKLINGELIEIEE